MSEEMQHVKLLMPKADKGPVPLGSENVLEQVRRKREAPESSEEEGSGSQRSEESPLGPSSEFPGLKAPAQKHYWTKEEVYPSFTLRTTSSNDSSNSKEYSLCLTSRPRTGK